MEHFLELRAKQDDIRREGVAIFDKARDEERDTTAEEDKRLAKLQKEIASLRTEEARYILENNLQGQIAEMGPALGLAAILPDKSDAAHYAGGWSYRDLFHGGDKYASLDQGSFENFEEFLKTLSTGRHDPRLAEVSVRSDAMTEGIDSEGGFLVPEGYGQFLWDDSLEREIVRPRAKVWGMKRDTLKVPGWSGFDHTSNVYGGFAGVWLAEAGTATRQKATLRQIQLIAKKLGIYSQASRELIEDGVSYEAQLREALTSAMAFYLDYAFFTGDGVGKPLGILNDPALVTVAKESAQAASTVVYKNICKMLARLHPSAFKNAIWVANQTCLPQFMTMTIEVGTAGGSHIKAVEERGGQFTLLGKELLFTEKLPTLGTKGDVFLVDLSKYVIGMRKEIILDKSNAPGWTEDLTDYRTILRCDGQGSWNSAVTPKNGDGLSWCVTLATRGA